jgi:hypothetical protein
MKHVEDRLLQYVILVDTEDYLDTVSLDSALLATADEFFVVLDQLSQG